MSVQKNNFQGLTAEEVKKLQKQFGKNELTKKKKQSFITKTLHVISEPMFLLLLAAAVIYFILGEPRDGLIMLIFVIGIIGIDVYQEWKTDKTLSALKDLTASHVRVIRDGTEQSVLSEELVPGDLIIISEGVKIPADGKIVKANDLCVDESTLTGEAEGVWKSAEQDASESSSDYWRKDFCYAGTLVTQGSAVLQVEKTGANTEYGKIGAGVMEAPERPSPLKKQTGELVRVSALVAAVLFVTVCLITYANLPDHAFHARIIESILSGITLAMAMIPEEFPVILTVFLSMGAWRLAKKNSLVRKLSSVETLGAVSVLCVDKTGTITMNQMTVCEIWAGDGNEDNLAETMGLACETETYDPMEKAMLAFCEERGISRDHIFGGELITEYSFTNELKMMGHVWHHDGEILVAAKGSAERILELCKMSEKERSEAENKIRSMSEKGLRVIAVGILKVENEDLIPESIMDCELTFCGLTGLYDPPRKSVKKDIERCAKAGVRVVMITGDNGITASAIARQVGIDSAGGTITGDELNDMSDAELEKRVKSVNVFSRVIPEHKMRIVKAFQKNGEIVAMTGDGVNDAPALKHADIGIAMGKRGSEVSREAASLVLLDDNFSTIVDTVKDGRKIYDNIKRAVGYVFTIHIPIALSALLAPILNVSPGKLLLLPLHVVLLELIIDPTCSIVLERQPEEKNIMERAPRSTGEKLIDAASLTKSLLQGLIIFASSFGLYYSALAANPDDAGTARALGISVIMLSNLFLVFENSSNTDSIFYSIRRLSKDTVMWGVFGGTVLGLFLILYSPLCRYLKLAPLSAAQLITVLAVSAASVLWYEVVKLVKRGTKK